MTTFARYFGPPPADRYRTENRYSYTASAGQTEFAATYTVGYVDVYYNGSHLDPRTAFTAADGAQIVLTTPADAGASVLIIAREMVSVENIYTQAATDALLADRLYQVAGYGDLRSYSGNDEIVYVTGFVESSTPSSIAGAFVRDDSDTTSSDNSGTIIVDSSNRRWKRIINGPVSDGWFGAAGDGATNDSAVLLNAANAAVTAGRTLSLNGSKTYAISSLALPAGLRLETNGATLKDATGNAGNTPLVTVNSGCAVDFLNVSIPAGLVRDRAVVLTGDAPRVERILVVSVDQQANSTDNDDAAVRVAFTTNPQIGRIDVTNYDKPVQVKSCAGGTIDYVTAESYVRALLLEDCTDFLVCGTNFSTASPNASYTAGHVGILISGNVADSSRNITILDALVNDAGEHGIRIAGPEQQSNITIVRPRIKNVGGSGIKILGTDSGTPTARNKRIQIIDPIIEDCGSGGLTSNMCGILVMYCDNVRITNPVIRKEGKAQCGYSGIRLAACGDVHILQPDVDTATFDGIWADGSLGDIDRLHITGGITRNCGRDGLRGTTGVSTTTFRRWNVDGLEADSNTGLGLNIAIGGGALADSLFRMKVYSNTGGAAACDNAAAALDMFGAVGATPLSGISAANGSRWSNGTTLNYRKAGAWTAL